MSPAYQGVIGPGGFASRSGNRRVITVAADRGVDAGGRRFSFAIGNSLHPQLCLAVTSVEGAGGGVIEVLARRARGARSSDRL
jgi:hypothetical protein